MASLKKGLLDTCAGPAPIVVRAFGSRSDLFRAMVVGPPDTPYSHVPFFFDFALPSSYPREPPLAHFHAHYVGNERLNPNLYVDGKVCLSLLGTWSGPSWDPQRSTLLQVLVSLQGLVLVEEPYFNEPGHECDAGTEQGRQASALYSEHARLFTLRAALNVANSPPLGFHEIVADHFARFGPVLVREVEEALEGPKASKSSEGFRKVLAKTLPRLRDRFAPRQDVASAADDSGSTSAAAARAEEATASAADASAQ
jgi:ubiquitin-conjugating enzyme E2 O